MRFASAHREKSEFAIKASHREIMRDLIQTRRLHPPRGLKSRARAEKAKGISQPRYHRGIIFPSPCHLPSSDIAPRFSERHNKRSGYRRGERRRGGSEGQRREREASIRHCGIGLSRTLNAITNNRSKQIERTKN